MIICMFINDGVLHVCFVLSKYCPCVFFHYYNLFIFLFFPFSNPTLSVFYFVSMLQMLLLVNEYLVLLQIHFKLWDTLMDG